PGCVPRDTDRLDDVRCGGLRARRRLERLSGGERLRRGRSPAEMITPFANLASNASTAALDRRDGATVVYRACGVVDEGSRDSRHLAGRARGLRPARSEASCFRGAGEVGAVLPDRGKTGRWKPVVGPVAVGTGGGSGGGGRRGGVWRRWKPVGGPVEGSRGRTRA